MKVTLQVKTAYGVSTAAQNDSTELVTVMNECDYGDNCDNAKAEQIFRAVRYLNEALGADLEVIVSIDNT